ncbi:hypothetical protein WJX84_002632 [Apatococcus fuscideae]|uniref:Uncharacterized protein n=1 Tax=Apatococcus fuscideae TaxID=2026836 RepID=A0AAW1SZ70_9CHLO
MHVRLLQVAGAAITFTKTPEAFQHIAQQPLGDSFLKRSWTSMRGEPSPAVELSPKCSVEAIQIPAGQTSQTECVDLPGDVFCNGCICLLVASFHTWGRSIDHLEPWRRIYQDDISGASSDPFSEWGSMSWGRKSLRGESRVS